MKFLFTLIILSLTNFTFAININNINSQNQINQQNVYIQVNNYQFSNNTSGSTTNSQQDYCIESKISGGTIYKSNQCVNYNDEYVIFNFLNDFIILNTFNNINCQDFKNSTIIEIDQCIIEDNFKSVPYSFSLIKESQFKIPSNSFLSIIYSTTVNDGQCVVDSWKKGWTSILYIPLNTCIDDSYQTSSSFDCNSKEYFWSSSINHSCQSPLVTSSNGLQSACLENQTLNIIQICNK